MTMINQGLRMTVAMRIVIGRGQGGIVQGGNGIIRPTRGNHVEMTVSFLILLLAMTMPMMPLLVIGVRCP